MKLRSTYVDISHAMSALGAGEIIGAIAGGVVVGLLPAWQETYLITAHTIAVIVVVLMPYASYVPLLWTLFFINGLFGALIYVGKYTKYTNLHV